MKSAHNEQQDALNLVGYILSTMTKVSSKTVVLNGSTRGILTFSHGAASDDNKLEMDLSVFDGIYKSFVKCWPVVKPLKDSLVEVQRNEGKEAREAAKVAEKTAKDNIRALAKLETARARSEAKLATSAAKAEAKASAAILKANVLAAKEAAAAKATAEKNTNALAALKAAADRLANTGSAKIETKADKKAKK